MKRELVPEKLKRAVRKRRRSALRDGPDPIDAHVGERIDLRRILSGVSQAQLSNALGISFQRVQKYERGANRVSASTLYRVSNATMPFRKFSEFGFAPSSDHWSMRKTMNSRGFSLSEIIVAHR